MCSCTSAYDRALNELRSMAIRHRQRGIQRLPGIRQIAASLGLSVSTVQKAVATCCADGLLTAKPGRGLELRSPAFASPAEPPLPLVRKPTYRWEKVREAMERSILSGRFEPGARLPSPKEIAAEHGISYHTARKVLRELAASGVITRRLHSFVVPPSAAPDGYRDTVVLISRGDTLGNLQLSTPRIEEHIRVLEGLCGRSHVKLRTFTYDFRGDVFYPAADWRRVMSEHGDAASVLGFLLWPIAMSAEKLGLLIARLTQFRCPIAVLDESGAVAPSVLSHRGVRVFTMATSATATRQVARFLIGLSHRHVAFISPFHDTIWSQNRLEGAAGVFEAAGMADGVRAFTCATAVNSGEYWPALEKARLALRRAREDLSAAGRSPVNDLAASFLDAVRADAVNLMETTIMRSKVEGLYAEALADERITAWICANDVVAERALAFLLARGRRVPEDISVVGLDDSIVAYTRKITSYNFSGTAAMNAMMSHILAPPRGGTAAGSAGEVVEIEGFINARATTGKARDANDTRQAQATTPLPAPATTGGNLL